MLHVVFPVHVAFKKANEGKEILDLFVDRSFVAVHFHLNMFGWIGYYIW